MGDVLGNSRGMLGFFRAMYGYRDLLITLVVRNLKIRYKNSALGFFWTLLGPVFMIAIYAVFLRVMRFPIYLPALVTGIIAWQFLATCMGDSLHAIVGNANLVTKSAFPRIALPLSMVVANLVNFLLSTVVLFGYLLVVRASFGALYCLPLVMICQFALCLGASLLLSCCNVFFRDTEHILSTIMLAWFFLTPVIYPIALVTEAFPDWVHRLFFVNPMTGIMTWYRMVLLSAPSPGWDFILLSLLSAWLVLLVGLVVFRKVEPGIADEL
ncbi:ABC transporter permease [Verrucomicrobiota bacterium]